jgi:S1-C subfamily serine protease
MAEPEPHTLRVKGPEPDPTSPQAPELAREPAASVLADTPVAAGTPGSGMTRLRLLSGALALVLAGGAGGGATAWWLATTGPLSRPTVVTLAPWDGPNVVGEAASRVAGSVYTIVGIRRDDGSTTERTGTAVVWRSDGLLVTNFHVAGGSGTVRLLSPDGRLIDADVVGGDARSDLSVLRVSEAVQVPVWSENVPPVGALAVAVGAPFGLGGSVSAGIVSATHRSVGVVAGAALADLIQFDAAVNPGNSGGPLINAGGEVFGLVTAIYSTSGVNDGVAFALPAALVTQVASALVEGSWEPGYLGVLVADLAGGAGVLVHDVVEGTAADRAGLAGGDVIVTVEGAGIRDVADLVGRISRAGRGNTVAITVEREGAPVTLSVTLGEDPQKRR